MHHRVVGLLLMAAAAIKYCSPGHEHDLIIPVEALIGTGLLFQLSRWVFLPVAIVLFVSFTGYHIGAIVIGRTSCDCLGTIISTPWSMILINLLALVALALPRRSADRALDGKAVGMMLFVLALCLLPHLERHDVSAPKVIELGAGQLGSVERFKVEIQNVSSSAVTVLGGTADCTCATIGPFPATIAPRSSVSLTVAISRKESGAFERSIVLFTDAVPRNLMVRIRGTATE